MDCESQLVWFVWRNPISAGGPVFVVRARELAVCGGLFLEIEGATGRLRWDPFSWREAKDNPAPDPLPQVAAALGLQLPAGAGSATMDFAPVLASVQVQFSGVIEESDGDELKAIVRPGRGCVVLSCDPEQAERIGAVLDHLAGLAEVVPLVSMRPCAQPDGTT